MGVGTAALPLPPLPAGFRAALRGPALSTTTMRPTTQLVELAPMHPVQVEEDWSLAKALLPLVSRALPPGGGRARAPTAAAAAGPPWGCL